MKEPAALANEKNNLYLLRQSKEIWNDFLVSFFWAKNRHGIYLQYMHLQKFELDTIIPFIITTYEILISSHIYIKFFRFYMK